jgi:hypothetical protein
MVEGKGPLVGPGYSKRSGICFNMIIYISVFSGLIFALKYAGSLELGTVSSVEETTTSQVLSTSNNKPPEATYVKRSLEDLNIKMSSFQVCFLEPVCDQEVQLTLSTTIAKTNHEVNSHAVHRREGSQSSMYF